MTDRTALIWSALGIGLLGLATTVHPSIWLAYNASDSGAKDFYLVRSADELAVGDYVVARLSVPWRGSPTGAVTCQPPLPF